MTDLVIGLTGPTGAGKSTVAAAFQKAGCLVVDADRIARLTISDEKCLSALRAEFGNDIVGEDNRLNRTLLAQRAFSDKKSTQRLNAITHPLIKEEIVRQINECRKKDARAVILDAPLLFESGADSLCTVSVAVTAPAEVRLYRIVNRDSITPELAKARMSTQQDDAYYHSRAQYLIDGTLSISDTQIRVNQLLEQIIGDYE
ncbi:dephospho-CoA kinase [Caproiciproducens faecalis]|uniref:Dephospho-CoA kinase n=1 Tax=Caproiciproducens faecalis TaxID=2820301 RepID=A0ABS7DQ39_9FIRM|nr:dephospho-CoA kinase [Caproiciproducens faecalis]MBW7573420.1 dephospho-CoA kinase [Caproiciproducens faecalis]